MTTASGRAIKKLAYYEPELWARLRKRLFDEGLGYSEWAREQAEAYLAAGKRQP